MLKRTCEVRVAGRALGMAFAKLKPLTREDFAVVPPIGHHTLTTAESSCVRGLCFVNAIPSDGHPDFACPFQRNRALAAH